MAATKIFAITATESKALSYIANPEKTDNGRLVFSSGCSRDPLQAAHDFEDIRAAIGTGLNTVLSQHFVMSFKPGEITPERALEIGKELCEKFLKDEYQYLLAVHTDTEHIHLHCIFNNVNCVNGRTFETNENQGKIENRKWKKFRDQSDEICKKHHLSVIENPEKGKGKSHYEWDMNRQGLSWKAKLKYAIDKTVTESDSFEDFLEKCKGNGILVDYNPAHKIDLKFMLAEQKENNPNAKFTRAKTLGWYYETQQIKGRIDMYKGLMSYTLRTKIRQTNQQENKFVQDAIDRNNMKLASIAKNIITEYGVEPENIRPAALSAYAHRGHLLSELNSMQTEIEDLQTKLKVLRKFRKLKSVNEQLKSLSGKQAKQYRKDHSSELNDYSKCRTQVLEFFPTGRTPTVEAVEEKINALKQERSEKNIEYQAANKKSHDLAEAQRTIEEFLRQEQREEQEKDSRKRKKNGDLE